MRKVTLYRSPRLVKWWIFIGHDIGNNMKSAMNIAVVAPTKIHEKSVCGQIPENDSLQSLDHCSPHSSMVRPRASNPRASSANVGSTIEPVGTISISRHAGVPLIRWLPQCATHRGRTVSQYISQKIKPVSQRRAPRQRQGRWCGSNTLSSAATGSSRRGSNNPSSSPSAMRLERTE
eukprot:scaffold96261_cov34-Tisochrysis_lutea.AAC.2